MTTNISTNTLTFRNFRDEDLPAALRLWDEHSGWGAITADQWRDWYVKTPCGSSRILVAAEESGRIIGQLILMPMQVCVGDRVVPAARITAPILHRDFRSHRLRSADHPITRLLDLAVEVATTDDFALIYAMPEVAWLSFFRWYPRFKSMTSDCVSIQIPAPPPGPDPTFQAHLSDGFGAAHVALWKTACSSFSIQVALERTPDLLRYRNGGHLVLDVVDRADGELVGYAAIHPKTGLIVDFVARSGEFVVPVLSSCLDRLAALTAQQRSGIERLKAMRTPVLTGALDELGFQPENYRFLFVCESLDPAVGDEAASPQHWYLTPGD